MLIGVIYSSKKIQLVINNKSLKAKYGLVWECGRHMGFTRFPTNMSAGSHREDMWESRKLPSDARYGKRTAHTTETPPKTIFLVFDTLILQGGKGNKNCNLRILVKPHCIWGGATPLTQENSTKTTFPISPKAKGLDVPGRRQENLFTWRSR